MFRFRRKKREIRYIKPDITHLSRRAYKAIMNTPPPDHRRLKATAEAAMQHIKEG